MEGNPFSERFIFFAVLICAGIFSGIYMGHCWLKRKKHPQILNVGLIFGSSLGLISGLNLCVLVCLDKIQPGGTDEQIAVFVGGVATCWFSIVAMADGFKSRDK
jgi:hypothetical protein